MSQLRLNKVAAPSAPAAGKGSLYFSSVDSKLHFIDESGNDRVLSGMATADYRLVRVVSYLNGTTTYTPTTGTKALYVECIGGGGSGGGCATAVTDAAAAGGGGGGAYSAKWVTGTIKASYTVAVGAGGTAPAAGANPGNAGGDTTFDSPSIVTAKGGSGGGADTVAAGPRFGGAGGAGGASASGVGDVTTAGAPGGSGIALAAAQALSGRGGDGGGLNGGGGIEVKNSTGGGSAGGLYGGGGSGACIVSGGASQAGGAGGNGLLRIYEFA